MKLWSDSFLAGGPIAPRNAFAKHHPEAHLELTDNKNPHLAWADLPEGTKSLALIVHDPDVPSVPDDVNQEGKSISDELERIDFYHWILIDLAPEPSSIAEGELSDGVTPRGKDGPPCSRGRQGINNYTAWFKDDAEMQGTYYGYDGPCPPWNDTIVHHYFFTLYALSVERVDIEGELTGQAVLDAIKEHTIGKASTMGTYTINPDAVDLRA